jgi:shikimate dehydrogenase
VIIAALATAALARRARRRQPPHPQAVEVFVGPATRYILSTSGRPASARRYRMLLQEMLLCDYAYMPFSVDGGGKVDPRNFAMALRSLNAVGGAISKDIKGTIAAELDEVDEVAAHIGAVNTVVVRSGRLVGYNTDALGFEHAIRDGLKGLTISTAVVYGYGGVTAVVAVCLQRLGMRVLITGRRRDAAAARAAQLGVELFDDAHSICAGEARLFVNAAPVSDAPLSEAPNLLAALEGCAAAFDHEMPGAFLRRECEARGIRHIAGLSMYWPQMIAQWTLFLEGILPASEVEAALREADRRAALGTD